MIVNHFVYNVQHVTSSQPCSEQVVQVMLIVNHSPVLSKISEVSVKRLQKDKSASDSQYE